MADAAVRLDCYRPLAYSPGAPVWKQLLWYCLSLIVVESHWIPWSGIKVWLLRCFGAQIGQHVRIKPGVRVKFPWRLEVGDYVWIGEGAWLDNLAPIRIESHVCISQGVYLCTGNHDWSRSDFQLSHAPIHIEAGSWIAARASVGPGVCIGRGAVLTLGSITTRSLEPMTIYSGNPAQAVKQRFIVQ
jgi:putative colanic acid biosynthesis acetyltransferase WcaF